MSVLKLRPMRERNPVFVHPRLLAAMEAFGLPITGPFTHLELWRRGANSYVMAVAGATRVNVSHGIKFADRDDARKWARAYAESHHLAPEPTVFNRREGRAP